VTFYFFVSYSFPFSRVMIEKERYIINNAMYCLFCGNRERKEKKLWFYSYCAANVNVWCLEGSFHLQKTPILLCFVAKKKNETHKKEETLFVTYTAGV